MLTIIKWIFLIALIIILILFGILLYLVISAFSYAFKGEFRDNILLDFTLHDPLRIYKIAAGYNKKPYITVKVLFGLIKVFNLEDKPEKNKKYEKEEKEKNFSVNKDSSNESTEEKKTSSLDKIKNIYAEITDEDNKEAVSVILKKVIWVLKKLLPKKKYFDLDFSAGTPDKTGEITAFISMFSFFYGGDMCIRPDFVFHDPYIDGKVDFSGKGRLVYFIIAIVGAMMNKSVMKLFKKLK